MACGCKAKRKPVDLSIKSYSVKVSGFGGQVISAGVKETCLLEVNGVLQKLNAGDTFKTYQITAAALLDIGAPIWIAA